MNGSVVANGEAVAVGHPLLKVFKDFQAEGRTPCHALSVRGKEPKHWSSCSVSDQGGYAAKGNEGECGCDWCRLGCNCNAIDALVGIQGSGF